jgi:transposase-like protein
MAPGKPRDPRKEQLWRRRILLWQRSGLSVRDFCDQHDLNPAGFYRWRRFLRQRETNTPTFLPVRLVPDPEPQPTPCLEILLNGRRRLRVPDGFDPLTLRQLLAVLEETPPC